MKNTIHGIDYSKKKNYFDGKKTYIFSGMIVLFSILYALNIIDVETLKTLIGIFVGLAGMAMRHGISKMQS